MGEEYGLKIIITRMELQTEMELRAKEQHFSSHCLLTMANRSHQIRMIIQKIQDEISIKYRVREDY
jgi:hypothetical protein